MPHIEQLPPPSGQAEVADLVRRCWSREAGGPDRPLPVIALLGRPGSGKTLALDHFEAVTRGAPTARVDFAAVAEQRPFEVALHLAFLLSRRYPGIRPLRFPRLLLGLLAIQPDLSLSLTDRRQARDKLRTAYRQARSQGAQEEGEAGDGVAWLLEALGLSPVPGVERIVGVLLRGFQHLPPAAFLNRALASYGSGGTGDALEELVDLNRRARSEAAGERAFVDRTLLRAFLRDLRAAYTRGRRQHHCLVLLDDIDHGRGAARFLDLLLHLRTEDARSDLFDPLLLVVTSATTRAVPGPSDGLPGDPHLRPAADADYEDWLTRSGTPPSDWWYPIRLRDLDEVEVNIEAARFEAETARGAGRQPSGSRAGLTPLVHRLTYGHPWSVRQLHAAIGDLLAHGTAPADLRGLLSTYVRLPEPLGEPEPAPAPHLSPVPGSHPQLSGYVLDHLLTGLTPDQRVAATRLAAARTPNAAVNCGLLNDQTEHARDTVMRELRNRLWLSAPVPEDANTRGGTGPSGYLRLPAHGADSGDPDTTADSRPVLHPWLRLLLLEEISGPPAGSVEDWQTTHRTLRDWHQRHGQPLDTLYHRLALNELDAVVAYFVRGLSAGDLRPWLRELYHVTAAPMYRAQLSDAPPPRRAGELAREHAPEAFRDRAKGRPLAELCAALWLAGDPRNRLPVGSPELNYKISAMFRQLVMVADSDADTLLNEATRYTD